MIINSSQSTLSLWELAACYGFSDLENYCLDKEVYEDLLKKWADPKMGLPYFAGKGIDMTALNGLVTRVAGAALQKACFYCLRPSNVGGKSSTSSTERFAGVGRPSISQM